MARFYMGRFDLPGETGYYPYYVRYVDSILNLPEHEQKPLLGRGMATNLEGRDVTFVQESRRKNRHWG